MDRAATFLTGPRDFVDLAEMVPRDLEEDLARAVVERRDFDLPAAVLAGTSLAGIRINSPPRGDSKNDSPSRALTLTMEGAGAE